MYLKKSVYSLVSHKAEWVKKNPLKFLENNFSNFQGYELHQISALAEWGCAISQIFFIQSFGPEFEDISLDYYLKSHYVPRGALEQEEYENEYQGYGI